MRPRGLGVALGGQGVPELCAARKVGAYGSRLRACSAIVNMLTVKSGIVACVRPSREQRQRGEGPRSFLSRPACRTAAPGAAGGRAHWGGMADLLPTAHSELLQEVEDPARARPDLPPPHRRFHLHGAAGTTIAAGAGCALPATQQRRSCVARCSRCCRRLGPFGADRGEGLIAPQEERRSRGGVTAPVHSSLMWPCFGVRRWPAKVADV